MIVKIKWFIRFHRVKNRVRFLKVDKVIVDFSIFFEYFHFLIMQLHLLPFLSFLHFFFAQTDQLPLQYFFLLFLLLNSNSVIRSVLEFLIEFFYFFLVFMILSFLVLPESTHTYFILHFYLIQHLYCLLSLACESLIFFFNRPFK